MREMVLMGQRCEQRLRRSRHNIRRKHSRDNKERPMVNIQNDKEHFNWT
jgi:hypothetical protein